MPEERGIQEIIKTACVGGQTPLTAVYLHFLKEEGSVSKKRQPGMNGPENCPMCIQDGKDDSMAGRIIGFAILLMLLFLAMKILS